MEGRVSSVTREQVAAYQQDGAICLRNVLTKEEVEVLRTGIDYNLEHPSARAITASALDDPGKFVEDFCCWQSISEYRSILFDSPLPRVAALLMESKHVRLYHDHMLTKEPGTCTLTPWHQDQPYYNVEGRQNVSFWIPVDSVRRHSTLEFVAGSHNGPWLMPRTFMDQKAKWFSSGSLEELPDIDAQRNAGAVDVLGWAMEPGDVVVILCFFLSVLT